MAALIPIIPWVAASLISVFGGAIMNKINKSKEQKELEKLFKKLNQEKNSQQIDSFEAQHRDQLLFQEREELEEKQRLLQVHREMQDQQKKKLQNKLMELNAMLENMKKELEEQKKKSKEANDPKMYKEAKKAIFNSFLDNLKVFHFTDVINKVQDQKCHIVMGLTSVGKSSLLMKVTGFKLEVGVGETTVGDAHQIGQFQHENYRVRIFDSPGINDDFSCYDIKTLAFLYEMDEVFIIYKDSIKYSTELFKIMNAIRKERKLILVRTQCDRFNPEDQRTCEEEIQFDRKYMEGLGIPCEIFAFSSKKGPEFMNNEKVTKMIMGESVDEKKE